MTPISKKEKKDKRSCNQVKGERGKMGSGGPARVFQPMFEEVLET